MMSQDFALILMCVSESNKPWELTRCNLKAVVYKGNNKDSHGEEIFIVLISTFTNREHVFC